VFSGCLFLLAACSNTPEKPVSKFGISFTCPAGWAVDESEDDAEDVGYYISVEKKGFGASGLFTVVIINAEEDLAENLEHYQEILDSQALYADLKFQPITEDPYGKYQGIHSSYTTNVMTVPHEGHIYVFSDNGKTVCIVEQEATEDKAKNAPGFKTLKETFIINDGFE
jgi:hypothetical protein